MSKPRSRLRNKWSRIIFESDTKAGKDFDLLLLLLILISVLVVILDSVSSFHLDYGKYLFAIEWIVTILFTIEYFARIYTAKRALGYIFSFFGIIDLLAIFPTYLSLAIAGSHYLAIIRILRLLRIFRILKLMRFVNASNMLGLALRESRYKILIFLSTVLVLVVVMGSIMYLVEGPEHGFLNIPVSIYWAVVTLTTVGYGDVAPQTPLGQIIASLIMILGYAIIAVPTGIITVEMAKQSNSTIAQKKCPNCAQKDIRDDDTYCRNCGIRL